MRNRIRASVFASLLFSVALAFAGCSGGGNSSGNAAAPDSANSADNASAGSGASSSAESKPERSKPASVTIPEGTSVSVALDTALSSAKSQPGDAFGATLLEPITAHGAVVIPRHARVRGQVADARPSGRLSKPALLSLDLTEVQVNGTWVRVATHDVTLEGKSHKKRDLVAIGGGSALGAIIGGIAGGGKGAAIGAAAGGGAGTAGAALTGKKDITLPVEAHVTFHLSRAATVTP